MQDIRILEGIGEARAKSFYKKGIKTVEDLLYFFPRDYEDRSNIKNIIDCAPGESVMIKGAVVSTVRENRIRKNMTIYSMNVADETGIIAISWYNNRFIKNIFKKDDQYVFFGKINPNAKKKEIIAPVYEQVGRENLTGKIVPIYPLWQNLTQKFIQNTMTKALKASPKIDEYIPQEILEKYDLCSISDAISSIHFPKSFDDFKRARNRLVFEELLILQLALLYKKGANDEIKREPFSDISCVDEFLASLSFKLTKAQTKSLNEILADFKRDTPMNRLLQGDVGSGKTVVAAASMYVTVKNGYQAAIMVPTEILATQHYESFLKIFKNSGIKICLLCGSTKGKKDIYKKIENKEYDIIIGTHALIQEGVRYNNLGLVITDEQHRFGVSQRAAFTNKQEGVHTLVMSATPIPRTLAFILYGDLDISVIDELPPGRKIIKTYAVGEDMKKRVYAFIEKNIKESGQCYIVCPLIKETDKSDLENAVGLAEKLKGIFPNRKVGLVHGKMKPAEKDEIMGSFKNGEIDILVSTTVIEVGVNVPNANIMIIENAERFGLSQLHQLRGRVGRGNEQSFCILFAHGTSEVTKKRMETMCKSNDGFFIAQEDLKLRGPGDFFGTRQHGLPEMKIANLFSDIRILQDAQKEASQIIKCDRLLSSQKYFGLKEKVDKLLDSEIILN